MPVLAWILLISVIFTTPSFAEKTDAKEPLPGVFTERFEVSVPLGNWGRFVRIIDKANGLVCYSRENALSCSKVDEPKTGEEYEE